MNVLANMSLGIVAGYAAHYLESPTHKVFGNEDIGKLAQYTEGTLLIIAVFSFFSKQIKPPEWKPGITYTELNAAWRKYWEDSIIALILTAFSVGGGTVLGYMKDGYNRMRS
jgi:hypothetical protein